MNVDHFSFIQAEDVLPHKKRKGKKRRKHVAALPSASDDSFGSSGLVESLLAQYQALPAEHKAKERDYNVVHINPSVIPTYLPAFRIWEYNTTIEGKWRQPQDVVEVQGGNATLGWGASAAEEEVEEDDEEDDAEELATPASGSSLASFLSRYLATSLSSRRFLAYLLDSPAAPTPLKHKRRHKKKRKKGPSYPRLARHSSALSPSRHNSFLSPLAFTQYYLRLDEFNAFEGYGTEERLRQGGERPRPEWVVEYTTRRAEEVAQLLSEVAAEDGEGENAELRLWPTSVREALREGKDEKEVVERLRREDVTPYEMEDLTIGRWLKLGRKVAEGGKAWKEFRKRMFVSSKTDD